MALDEPKEEDAKHEADGFTFIIDEEFLKKIEPVQVDFTYFGFRVSSNVDFSTGASCGSSCGTSCSTDGCC